MTDELEILKSDWKKRHTELPKLSYNEIYKMLFKKSTTIVKWIFIISIAELLFGGSFFTYPKINLRNIGSPKTL